MENFRIVYANTEVKKLYIGLQEGKSFVNLYWNSGIDTSLEKEIEIQVITIGVDNGKDIEFLEFLNINGKTIEIKAENYNLLYNYNCSYLQTMAVGIAKTNI